MNDKAAWLALCAVLCIATTGESQGNSTQTPTSTLAPSPTPSVIVDVQGVAELQKQLLALQKQLLADSNKKTQSPNPSEWRWPATLMVAAWLLLRGFEYHAQFKSRERQAVWTELLKRAVPPKQPDAPAALDALVNQFVALATRISEVNVAAQQVLANAAKEKALATTNAQEAMARVERISIEALEMANDASTRVKTVETKLGGQR